MQIFSCFLEIRLYNAHLDAVMLRWCINKGICTIHVVTKQIRLQIITFMSKYFLFFIIRVISCSNISACTFLKIFFMFEYKCMHVFSKTKCIFKYKCMHVYARGYGTCIIHIKWSEISQLGFVEKNRDFMVREKVGFLSNTKSNQLSCLLDTLCKL